MTIKNGGPAFFVPNDVLHSGMTLRDYFAATALQGLLARDIKGLWDDPAIVSEIAFDFADAMLRARRADAQSAAALGASTTCRPPAPQSANNPPTP